MKQRLQTQFDLTSVTQPLINRAHQVFKKADVLNAGILAFSRLSVEEQIQLIHDIKAPLKTAS
jgi:hypothetical protein